MPNIILEKGGIFFNNITEGFDKFNYETIKINGESAYNFITKLYLENGSDNSFCDFYYQKLDNISKEKVEFKLNEEEIKYINSITPIEDVFYKLEPELLKIIIKLNESETLFSTIYFTKSPLTLWGNHNTQYIIFTLKGE